MPQQDSVWKRFGTLFRGRSNGRNGNSHAHAVLATAAALDGAPTSGAAVAADPPRSRGGLLRFGRREGETAQLREGYQRVIELIGAIERHFEQQDTRAAQLAGSVESVASHMQQLVEAQQAQGEYLRSIAEHAQVAGRHAAALTETLGRMPSGLQAQAEALRAVARQLEVAQESDTQLAHSLGRFEQAVDSLRASGAAQVETLQSMQLGQREQRDTLTTLVREQGRRFLVVICVAAVLALGALGGMGTALALSTGS